MLRRSLLVSGSITIDVDAQNVRAHVTGSGDIVLDGKAGKFDCEVVGSGEIKAHDLQTSAVTVTVNGSGNAKVYSNKAITGRINGSGNIVYSGEPTDKDLKKTGSGDYKAY
jgi:hypothetical protein